MKLKMMKCGCLHVAIYYIVAKKREKKFAPVPNFVRRRFPADHASTECLSDSNSDSESECDLSAIIPSKSVIKYSVQ
jgi:hypothetical protein